MDPLQLIQITPEMLRLVAEIDEFKGRWLLLRHSAEDQRHWGQYKMMESQLYKEIFGEGEAKGEAKALLRFFLRRFDYIHEALSRRVLGETRIELLERWFDEAVALPDASNVPALVERILRTPPPDSAPNL